MKIGTKVKLKSGGPVMTVILDDDGTITCAWFDAELDVHDAEFPADALEEVG